MDARQLAQSLMQVLENYQRCGISRFARLAPEELPEDWQQTVAHLSWGAAEREAPASPAEAAALARDAGPRSASREDQSREGQSREDQGAAEPGSIASLAAVGELPGGGASGSVPDQALSQPLAGVGAGADATAWGLPMLDVESRQQQLGEVRQQVSACRQCADIVHFRHQTVFGCGPCNPTICFMGEAPGADEDRTGETFVGKAGQLLSKIIVAMKLRREEVYILNALKCRPPQNRTPVSDEINHCRHFVATQLDILQPKYIVCLGSIAVQSLLQTTQPIGKLRGKFHTYRSARVVVTYHPSYLLRNESAKRLVWEDMQMLMREIGTL